MFKRSIILGNILSLRFTVYKIWIKLYIWRKGSWFVYLSWKTRYPFCLYPNIIFTTALSSKKDVSYNHNFMNDRQKWINLADKEIAFFSIQRNGLLLNHINLCWAYEFMLSIWIYVKKWKMVRGLLCGLCLCYLYVFLQIYECQYIMLTTWM